MEKLIITGGRELRGEVRISGAKNAILPILAACLMASEPVSITRVPYLNDVTTLLELLGGMGVQFTVGELKRIDINATSVINSYAPYDLVRKMRASFLVLGPLLARYGEAIVSLPGGCAIGTRPVNLHLEGLRAMGAIVDIENGYVKATKKGRLEGADIHFPLVTVTGTANLLMAATLAKGTTRIFNAAKEPEVVDLVNFLNVLGAKIEGAGTDNLIIKGVEKLSGGNYSVIPDRIEAATFLIAAVCTGGWIRLKEIKPHLLESVLLKIKETGALVSIGEDWIELDMQRNKPKAVDIVTAPYPGFPTDAQAQIMAMNVIAQGPSQITETLFENRFMHVQELIRLGARITLDGNIAHCAGDDQLEGAPVMATDLRASAGLILAGLVAKGETTVNRIYHIDRGYECIEEKLSQLGAKIKRVTN